MVVADRSNPIRRRLVVAVGSKGCEEVVVRAWLGDIRIRLVELSTARDSILVSALLSILTQNLYQS